MRFRLLGILILISIPTLAFRSTILRGAVSGGGGRGVVCRDQAGVIRSAQLLDLFEAERIFNLRLQPEKPSFEEEIESALLKINLGGHQIQITQYDVETNFNRRVQFVGDDLVLQPIDDSFEPIVPKDCKIEQVANYHQSGRLFIKEEIWKAFSSLNKAALVIHELAYLQARTRGQLQSSYYVRQFVGYMFSTNKLSSYRMPVPESGSDLLYCVNRDANSGLNLSYEFYLFPVKCTDPNLEPPKGYGCHRVVFSYLSGQIVYDQTELDLLGSNEMARAMDPRIPYQDKSTMATVESQIFVGTKFFFTVIEENGQRFPRVLLYENGGKNFVDLRCQKRR